MRFEQVGQNKFMDRNTNNNDNSADVSAEERAMLDQTFENDPQSRDNQNLNRSALDARDDDGEPLNEASGGNDISGKDLDVPGSEDDDDMEDIGEEDEENNSYSEADTD